jgi:antitoxin YefM
MKTMSYTESRAKYAEVLDAVVSDREEIVITRAGHEPVVIVSLEDFESLRETAYWMPWSAWKQHKASIMI